MVLVLVAHRHRHQRAQLKALGTYAALDQKAAQSSCHRRQHHVVDGASECVLHQLEVLKGAADADEAPVWADVHVQRARRRWIQTRPYDLAHPLGGLARTCQRAIGMRQGLQRVAHELKACLRRSAQTGCQQLDCVRLAVGLPGAAVVAHRGWFGGDVE